MLTRWQPAFKAEVITEGDPGVAHTGSMSATVGRPALRGPAATLTAGERTWLDENGIDWGGEGPGEDESAA